jgi:CTP synthase
MMEKEHLAQVACECLHLPCPDPDLQGWIDMINRWKNPKYKVQVALVGKYVSLHDAYISVVESLKHAGVANYADVDIKWVDSERISSYNVAEVLGDVDAIIVPGGFGDRGIEGMITAIQYARENKVPYLGLCLGMQLTLVEYARNVLGWKDAHSNEFSQTTTHPVIHIMPDQDGVTDLGGTLRLGSYPCVLADGSKAQELYGEKEIHERHRHRYEVNNAYRNDFIEGGMQLSGLSPDGRIVEIIEIPSHPWFVATQAHPEFKSRPNNAHPLFKGFIEAALKNK